MKKSIKIILYAVIVIALVGVVVFSVGNYPKSVPTQNNSTVTNGKVSAAELAKHNTEADCWVAYQGKVYDVTSWLPRHPGSAGAITPYCGTAKEFEDAFIAQHGTRFATLLMQVGKLMGDFQVQGNLQ